MKSKTLPLMSLAPLTAAAFLLGACGQSPAAATSSGNVSLVVAPLAGSAAASLSRPAPFTLAWGLEGMSSGLLSLLVGNSSAYAAVSSFSSFKLCNDTLVITDSSGNTVSVNGSTSQTGLGLLSFSAANTSNTSLTSLNIAAGTKIKEVKITSAVKGSVCSGAAYAVQFDVGSGPISITQDTAFKFTFASPVTITGAAQNLSLLFGSIVNGMVTLGAGLNNSSIQSVAASGVGQ